MTAATGRHWRTEVLPAVGGYVWPTREPDETAMFEPTHQFNLAEIEFAKRLDAKIAEACAAEQRRLAELQPPPVAAWRRAWRYVRVNWTPYRAAYVAATVGVLVGGAVGWLLR